MKIFFFLRDIFFFFPFIGAVEGHTGILRINNCPKTTLIPTLYFKCLFLYALNCSVFAYFDKVQVFLSSQVSWQFSRDHSIWLK